MLDAKITQWGKNTLQQIVLGQLDFKCAKLNSDHYFKSYTKTISKWIVDFNIRAKIMKLLEENIGKKTCDLGRQTVLGYNNKSTIKEKN